MGKAHAKSIAFLEWYILKCRSVPRELRDPIANTAHILVEVKTLLGADYVHNQADVGCQKLSADEAYILGTDAIVRERCGHSWHWLVGK